MIFELVKIKVNKNRQISERRNVQLRLSEEGVSFLDGAELYHIPYNRITELVVPSLQKI